MQNQLVPNELLEKSNKILFLTHLALGDFTYMQNYFKAFHEKYPHIKIDIWVDQLRGKSILWRGRREKKDILFDWLESCDFVNKVYKNTNSFLGFLNFLKLAKKENYPLIVSLGVARGHRYAKYAKIISRNAFNVGLKKRTRFANFIKKNRFKKLNNFINCEDVENNYNSHIVDTYSKVFEQFFGIKVLRENTFPFISFPKKWSYFGKLKFVKWGILNKERPGQRVVFINSFAKTKKRCWSLEKVLDLIGNFQLDDNFYDTNFIVNVLPQEYKRFKQALDSLSSKRIFLFTVDFNFFQLPAVISLCDLVVSVETSVIHLAAALKVPVVALMRQKNKKWFPLGTKYEVILTQKRTDWIRSICVKDVFQVAKTFL